MIRALHLRDVGPSRELDFEFAPRLNILTGDNGLGKSFVLDVVWWVLTGRWSGEKAFPWRPASGTAPNHLTASISATIAPSHAEDGFDVNATYSPQIQEWLLTGMPPANLVVYARIDGSFAVWDAYQASTDREDPLGGAVVSLDASEIWDGKESGRGKRRQTICRGLVEDWVTWQGTRSPEFESLRQALDQLSDPEDPLIPGPPTRVHLDDRRSIPTLEMPYGLVPVMMASAGQRRVLALAYMLVWTWAEHRKVSALTAQNPSSSMVLLLDEVELHLHPRWQRLLLPALIRALKSIAPDVSVQLLATTHAPMVLASIEPYFDEELDNLYRFERTGPVVEAHNLRFAKQGEADNWLVSEAFGLGLPRSVPSEEAIRAASAFMRGDLPTAEAALQRAVESVGAPPPGPSVDLKTRIHAVLCKLVPGHDAFWPRWIVSYERHGGLSGDDELRLPSLELERTDSVPPAERPAVDDILRWLRDDPRVMEARVEYYNMYREGELNFAGLTRKAPLIAAALRRQPEFLLPADQARLQAGDL